MDRIAEHALEIYNAFESMTEGDAFLPVSVKLDKYLEYIGYNRHGALFEIFGDVLFESGRRSLRITVAAPTDGDGGMEFTSHLADDYYSPREDSDEERLRQAARLLLGIDYAIDNCLQRLVERLVFGEGAGDHRRKAFIALYALARESV